MFNNKNKIIQDKRGVAALLTIVIVGAASLIMAYSASILGLGELDMGYTEKKGEDAFNIADGCMEEALRHLRLNQSYTGETLSLGSGSCIIGISSSGSDRTIIVTSTLSSYHKVLESNLTLSGSNNDIIAINSWEEK